MKKSVKGLVCAALCCALVQTTACALLPQEEVLPDAPILRQDDGDDFSHAYVQRGDLVRETRFSVTYRAVRQERLEFEEDGLRIAEVYVVQGDSVRAGQVLMELEQNDLARQLDSAKNACASLRLQLDQAKRSRELERDAYQLQLQYMSEKELETADTMEEHLRSADRAIEQLEHELIIAEKTEEQIEVSVARRQLRAGIDGVVTFVRNVSPEDVSDKRETMVILSDSESSMFVVETKGTELFPVGMEVMIYINQTPYPCRVISAQEAGASVENEVYFKSDIPTAELTDGDSGYLLLETERYNDVLYVNAGAVKSINGEHFVYIEDENGLRSIHEVTVGHTLDGYTEILSGLNEGDQVILR